MKRTHRPLIAFALLLAVGLALVVHAVRGGPEGTTVAGGGAEHFAATPGSEALPGVDDPFQGEELPPLPEGIAAGADEYRALVTSGDTLDAAEARFLDRIEWAGRVLDRESQEPIGGVEVVLRGGAYVGRAETDEAGEFTVPWSQALAASLALTHDSYVDLFAPQVSLEEPGEFLLRRSARIEGRIRPIVSFEEARVHAWRETASSRRYWESLEAEVRDDGTFTLTDLTEGDYAVTAVVPGMFVGLEMGIHVESGEIAEVQLVAASGSVVFGRLTRRDTHGGIGAAEVGIEPRTDGLPWTIRTARSAQTTSWADGSYELAGLAPGIHRLEVTTPWGAERREEVHIPESGSRVELDLSFEGPVTVSGYVLDADGKGVRGSLVLGVSSFDRRRILSTLERELQENASVGSSGSGGFFVLEDLPAGETILVVAFPPGTAPPGMESEERPRGLPGYATVRPVEAGDTRTDVVVELPPRFGVEGRVLAADGSPLESALVQAEYPSRRGSVRAVRTYSDEAGEFVLGPLRRGEVVIRAYREDYLSQGIPVKLGAEETTRIEFALEPCFSISGVALDEHGYGVPNIPIGVRLDKDYYAPSKEQGRRRLDRNTATDSYGRFEIDGLFDAPWIVRGGSYEWEMTGADPAVLVPSRESFTTVTFAPRERMERFAIAGRVTLVDGGVPTGVRITGLHGGVLEVDGGRFLASGLTPTRHRLRIYADGHVPRTVGPIEPVPGDTVNVGAVDLLPATRLTVRVQDRRGKAVEKARVRLIPLPVAEGGMAEEGWRIDLEDAGRGRYRHQFVPRYAWRLVAEHGKAGRHSQTIRIGAGPSQSVRVTLK